MIRKFFLCSAMVIALSLSGQAPVAAQSADASSLSSDQLRDRFERQQKTRSLVIAPSAQTATAATTQTATTVATTTVYEAVADDVRIDVNISFDFDSAALRADQKPKLAELCKAMKAVDVGVFQIVGHTDATGSANYNQRLSLLRAQEVKRHMVEECGIAADRLQTLGVGSQFPSDKTNPRGDVNRRVEFQALS